MLILGIESSCDETAAAVVEDGRKLHSNVVASQIEEHRLYGGVVPEIASRRHSEAISLVVQEAIDKAGITAEELDGIAVTSCPGLIGALLVGVNFAKGLSFSLGKPLIAVHHLRGHIASNYISHPGIEPPFLCLVVSGGHTNIIAVKGYTEFEILARTRDDAAGEAFDKAARSMGLPYPGGVEMDKMAQNGNSSAFEFPRPKVDGAPMDFSFSGLKTSVINLIHKYKQAGRDINVTDLAASYRRAVVEYLIDHFMMAAEMTGMRTLAVAGGVSANSLLRAELKKICDAKGYELYLPKAEYCGDNAAMIASQGYYELERGNIAGMNLNASAQKTIV